MNPSFLLACVAGAAVAVFVGTPIAHFTLGPAMPFVPKLTLGLGLGALYVAWVYHNIPTKNKAVVFLFGTYRVRMGPGGKGLVEGLNATPLGWPFMTVTNHPSDQKAEKFKQMQAISKDLVPVMLDGTYNYYIDDPYDTYNIENPKDALESTVLKWIRAGAEDFSAEELVSQEASGASTRTVLAQNAHDNIMRELEDPARTGWGYKITPALQINHIIPETHYAEALRKRQQEVIEGEYEQTQIDRRVDQIKKLTDNGVNPDLAAAFTQVEAEKPGANINTINLPGMQGIGEGVGKFAEGIRDLIRSKLPTQTNGGTK